MVEPYIDDISGEQYINHEFAKIKSLFEKENLDFFKNSYQEYEDKYLYDVDLVNYKKSNINIAKIEKFTIEKSLFILFFSFFTFILYFLFAFLAKSKK